MSNTVQIEKVSTNKQMDAFIKFPFKLYKGNKFWAPQINQDEKKTLSSQNPSLDFSDLECILAYQDSKLVGRMALIINHRYNKEQNKRIGKFGWVDFIDDYAVSKAMFDYAVKWHKDRNNKELHGPLGFTDFDYEGMLTKGFDVESTMATIYNYPYYNSHILKYGFKEQQEWLERRIQPKKETNKFNSLKLQQLAKIISQRSNVQLADIKTRKDLLQYTNQVFDLINIMYKNLYGFSTLTEKQIRYYVKAYFGFAIPRYIPIVVNKKNEVVAFVVSFPSFTKSLQKINGRLFPFGFLRMLYTLKSHRAVDFYLIAVHPKYIGKGMTLVALSQLAVEFDKRGINYIEGNIATADNIEMNNLYEKFKTFADIEVLKARKSYSLIL